MNEAKEALNKLEKADMLAKRAFHKNGPKSFKNGVGALLVALNGAEGSMTQRELVDVLGMGRKGVKAIVLKAVRSDLATIEESEEKKTYVVSLTEEGKEVVAKRVATDDGVAEKLVEGLTEEEIALLTTLCDKIVVNAKEMGVKGKRSAAFKHHRRSRNHRARQHRYARMAKMEKCW